MAIAPMDIGKRRMSICVTEISVGEAPMAVAVTAMRIGTREKKVEVWERDPEAARAPGRGNLRLGWTYRPGSDIFLVLNQTWDAPALGLRTARDRQAILKMTWMIAV